MRRYTLTLGGGRTLALGGRTLLMGVLNVTPDSFSDGGRHTDPASAVEAGVRMVAEGADLIDIGGESTRPGATPLGAAEELRRVLPVIDGLARRVTVPLSIDTYKAEVAAAAIDRGATIVNDISGLRYEPELAQVVARTGVPVVLMHTRGRSERMYEQATYVDIVAEVLDELRESIGFAKAGGVAANQIIVDPGLGFAKNAAQSCALLARCDALAELDHPLLVGPSRKSFLGRSAGGSIPPAERDWATSAAVTAAVLAGAHIVRVHAVREMLQVVRVADEIRRYHAR